MDGFLVLLRHSMDDLPIALFTTYEQASRFAGKVKPMPTAAIRKLFQLDSTPVSVCIVTFIKGRPKCWSSFVFSMKRTARARWWRHRRHDSTT